MKIVIISDTHGSHEEIHIPEGDILIHAGDFTEYGTLEEASKFNRFLSDLPHKHKIIIAGNHDFCFQKMQAQSEEVLTNCIYLKDNSVIIDGIKFYGSPWQPWFFGWAFNLQRGEEIRKKWELIEKDTEVLITHGPPLGYGDKIYSGEHVGCEELIKYVAELTPKLHIFGHVHESYGILKNEHTTFINGCVCDLDNAPVNEPIVLEF